MTSSASASVPGTVVTVPRESIEKRVLVSTKATVDHNNGTPTKQKFGKEPQVKALNLTV